MSELLEKQNTAFHLRDGQLYVEDIAVADCAARFGTPLYIYSRATLEQNWRAFDVALSGHPHAICYAVKANSNIAILNLLAKMGSGFDIVSQGELMRVLRAGGEAQKIVFSGVGKLASEIEYALAVGIGCFNVESKDELMRISDIASRMKKVAPIALRINPNIHAGTHPYISTGLKENKFGIDLEEVLSLYLQAAASAHFKILGIACHIGSQLTDIKPFLEAFDSVYTLYQTLKEKGITIHHLDLGGGLGVTYRNERPPSVLEYGKKLIERLDQVPVKLMLEPGRAIVANAGILVTRVEYLKHTGHKNFAIVDAGMNDLLRPALYQAEQEIMPVIPTKNATTRVYDVVGPVCETSDFLGKNRQLAIREGDLLAVLSAGAYGFTMSSNYNTRPRAAEVLVDGLNAHVIRRRETIEALFADESIIL